MKKMLQTKKNLELTEKFSEYIAMNPTAIKSFPSEVSFVPLSSEDEELNKLNRGLVDILIQEGKNVILAIETKSPKHPWRFSVVSK